MRRKLKVFLISCVTVVVLLATLSYCTSDNELKPSTPKPVVIESVKVKSSDLETFANSYQAFLDALSQGNRTMLNNFVTERETKDANAKTNVEATCTCQTGQASCRSDTWLSSCCVCWNPATHEGACASFAGMTFCRTEPINEPESKAGKTEATATFYPNRFSDLLIFASTNGIKTKEIEKAHLNLIASAIAE